MTSGNIKLLIGVLLVILFVLISFYTDYIHAMLFQTGAEIYLVTPSIKKELFSGEFESENIFFKATDDIKIHYEVVGEVKDWTTIEGSENIEKDKISRFSIKIEPPKNLLTNIYYGQILIHFENKIIEIPVSLNVTHLEPIKIEYGDKHSFFQINVEFNRTEFFGDLLDYKNHSTCFKINLPEGSENVYVEIGMEKDDDIDACIYSGNLDNPYMCSIRPRGLNESLKVIGVNKPLAVCLYASEGEKNPLIGNTTNFSGIINFGMASIENISNITTTKINGKIIYMYTINCKTCREFASALLDYINDKNITLKIWTDDNVDRPDFNKNLDKYIVGYYTPKDVDTIESSTKILLAEGFPDYAIDYLKNELPSSYTCVCTVGSMCDCFENEGNVEQRLMQTSLHFNNLMVEMA